MHTSTAVTDVSDRLKSLGPYVRKTLAPSVEALTARCEALESENTALNVKVEEQSQQIASLVSRVTSNDGKIYHLEETSALSFARTQALLADKESVLDAVTKMESHYAHVLETLQKMEANVLTATHDRDLLGAALDASIEKLASAIDRIQALELLSQQRIGVESTAVTTRVLDMGEAITSQPVWDNTETVDSGLQQSVVVCVSPPAVEDADVDDNYSTTQSASVPGSSTVIATTTFSHPEEVVLTADPSIQSPVASSCGFEESPSLTEPPTHITSDLTTITDTTELYHDSSISDAVDSSDTTQSVSTHSGSDVNKEEDKTTPPVVSERPLVSLSSTNLEFIFNNSSNVAKTVMVLFV
jgi:hypothetical protein